MKKHSLLKTLAIVILVVMLCAFLIPARGSEMGVAFLDGTASYIGFGDVIMYFLQSFYHFFDTVIFVLVVGAFYGVLNRVTSYKTFVNGIASKFKKQGIKVIIAITIIFALVASLTGIDLVLFMFIPFVVAIILAMGYDKLVAVSATVGATLVGTIGGLFTTYRDLSMSSYITFDQLVGLDMNATIIPRLILLIVGTALLVVWMLKHIKKTNNKEVKYDLGEKIELVTKADKKEKEEVSLWPTIVLGGLLVKYITTIVSVLVSVPTWYSLVCNIVILLAVVVLLVLFRSYKKVSGKLMMTIVFGGIFVFLVMGLVPWSTLTGATVFDEIHSAVISDMTIELPFGTYSLYTMITSSNFVGFGSWSSWGIFLFPSVMLIIVGLIIKFVFKVKFNDLFDGVREGLRKALPAGVLVGLAYTILICTVNNGFFETLVTAADTNVFLQLLISIFGSVFNVDLSYTSYMVFTPILEIVTDFQAVLSVGFQGIFGLVQMIAPTSLLLVVGLTYFDVPYRSWVKYIWKFVLALLIILFVMLLVLAML